MFRYSLGNISSTETLIPYSTAPKTEKELRKRYSEPYGNQLSKVSLHKRSTTSIFVGNSQSPNIFSKNICTRNSENKLDGKFKTFKEQYKLGNSKMTKTGKSFDNTTLNSIDASKTFQKMKKRKRQ